jgi:hypothetical protein
MKRLVALTAAVAALAFAGEASSDPGLTPHGYVGSCNGMTSDNAGMNNAVDRLIANGSNGINGMIISIDKTAHLGPPDFCG